MIQAKQSQRRTRRKIPKALVKVLYVVILAIPFVALSFLISSVSSTTQTSSSSLLSSSSLSTPIFIKASYLPNEGDFSSTFKECININIRKCKQYIPSGTTRQRIAVLAPPGEGVDKYWNILKNALITFYGSEDKMSKYLDLFQSSHVPPYGYGKTHGITKIVRIVNGPLIHQATEVISKVHQEDFSTKDGNIDTLTGVFQQMIRWHCRLNHVAAHTFMYNVHLDYKHLFGLTSMLVKFIVSDVGKTFPENFFRHQDQMKQVDAYLTMEFQKWSSLQHGSIFDSHIPESVLQRLETVLMKELNDTKNLTKWPCLGFWDVEDIDSQVVTQVATELVPDCKTQYSECSVKKDLCEEKGIRDCLK